MSARPRALIGIVVCLLVFVPSLTAQVRKRPAQGGVTTTKGVTQPAIQPPAAVLSTPEILSRALSDVAARDAARTEILAQLAQRRPIAFVNGYWVTPINVSSVINNPTVAGTLNAGGGSHLQVDQLRNGFGLVFTPDVIARSVMRDMARDITSSLAADALIQNTTDGFFRGVAEGAWIVYGGPLSDPVGTAENMANVVGGAWGAINEAIGDALGFGEPDDPNTGLPIDDPGADPDGDGTPNRLDGDDDGDGTTDDEDDHPYDPGEDICGYCPGGSGISFAARASATQLRAVLNVYSAAQPARNLNLSLGTVADRPMGLVILR
jgi:hypothetical protein